MPSSKVLPFQVDQLDARQDAEKPSLADGPGSFAVLSSEPSGSDGAPRPSPNTSALKYAHEDAENPSFADGPGSFSVLPSEPSGSFRPPRPSQNTSALTQSLHLFTNQKKNVSRGEQCWLLMRGVSSIVDQVLNYAVVATTILDRDYVMTVVEVALIIVAGWKTSFFVGSSFGNKKSLPVQPTPAPQEDENEEDCRDDGPASFAGQSGGASFPVQLGGASQSTRGESSGAWANLTDPGSAVRSKKKAEVSYLHNASIASAKSIGALVSRGAKKDEFDSAGKSYQSSPSQVAKGNPLNTVTMWGETSFISIVLSPKKLLKGIFEVDKFVAVWTIITGHAQEDYVVQKDVWGTFASAELARGLFMTIPQTYLQMYIFLKNWLGSCSPGAQAEIRGDASSCYLGPSHPETTWAETSQFLVTLASIASSLMSSGAACCNYELLMLRNSGLRAPRFFEPAGEYRQARRTGPIPLTFMLWFARALEVCARTVNVSFFLFFSSLAMSTKLAVVVGGEFVFLFGFAVRKVILTRAWRRAQRAQLEQEARRREAAGGADQGAGDAPAEAPPAATEPPSMRETARLLFQSVSITLPMYTTIHSQRFFEAAFGPGIPYRLFYGYRIGVQSVCLHLGLLMGYGVGEAFPQPWTVVAPVMMVALHLLWFPVWRAVVGEIRLFARHAHGVGN